MVTLSLPPSSYNNTNLACIDGLCKGLCLILRILAICQTVLHSMHDMRRAMATTANCLVSASGKCMYGLRCMSPSTTFLFTSPPSFVHTVHTLLAHNEGCEQRVWRGDAQTAFATSPLLYGPHICSQPPPIGASTQTVTRILFLPLPLMIGPFSHGTPAPPCSCLMDTHHNSTV